MAAGGFLGAADFFDAGVEGRAGAAGTDRLAGPWVATFGGTDFEALALGALGEGTKNCLPGPFGG